MDDDGPQYSVKLSGAARRYAELYPSAEPRLNAILRSRDPKLRQRASALARAILDAETHRQARLMAAYRLTRAEARLALHIIEGGTLAAYAKEAGVTAGTARNQLKSVFAKTGVARQAELVRLGQAEL